MAYDDLFWNLFANYGLTEAYITYRDFKNQQQPTTEAPAGSVDLSPF